MTETNHNSSKERVLLMGLYGPDTPRPVAMEHLVELESLALTAGGITIGRFLQNKNLPDPGTYIGAGKLRQISNYVKENAIDLIVFDDDLSPTQVRNIQQQANAKVIDRSGLILDIFASRAKSAAAKTQVELAQLQYLLPRLTRAWTHLSRQKGGIGTKGPGETQIETDRRMISRRIALLEDKLEKLNKQRITQRKGRSYMQRIALVGYTNAGKSTLMNMLTHTGVLAEDRLFATLDSTIRKFTIKQQEFLISDTVGFIRKLPHNLIESFKSTLDEIRDSDILLHVVDVTSSPVDDYIKVVQDTLREIKAESKPVILVFNKVDKMEDPAGIAGLKLDYPDAVWISAQKGIGLNRLEDEIIKVQRSISVKLTLKISVKDYKAVSFIHNVAEVIKENYEGENVFISFYIPKKYLGELKGMIKQNGITPSIVNK